MRLESALYASREGLHTHGIALDVVGDNVSNSNTVGFKSSRMEFADLFAAGEEGARSTSIEPVGNGVQVGQIRQEHKPGIIDSTGRPLDAAIDGGGFFIVGDPANPEYSRAGNFSVNAGGILVDSGGRAVLGFTPGNEAALTLSPLNIQNLNVTGQATTELTVYGNLDAGSIPVQAAPANPASFNDLNAQTSFRSTHPVFDSLGAEHSVVLTYTKTGNNQWTAQAWVDGSEVGGDAGIPVQIGQNLNVAFGPDGLIPEANAAQTILNAQANWSNGAAAGNVAIDLSGYTQYAAQSGVAAIQQNGQGVGQIESYEIETNGGVYAVLDTGNRVLAGTIALAAFTNIDALTRSGSGTFEATQEAGTRTVGTPGNGVLGATVGSALELSNVDIADQFVDLVIYQRGYQASSQTLNAANEMMRETLGLIR
jgi:flagellar hook protein FlgE